MFVLTRGGRTVYFGDNATVLRGYFQSNNLHEMKLDDNPASMYYQQRWRKVVPLGSTMGAMQQLPCEKQDIKVRQLCSNSGLHFSSGFFSRVRWANRSLLHYSHYKRCFCRSSRQFGYLIPAVFSNCSKSNTADPLHRIPLRPVPKPLIRRPP